MKRYDWLLTVYPRRFRRQFAPGMRTAFAADYARARAEGRLAALRFLAEASVLALWFGIAEWLPRPQTLRSFLSADVRDAVRALTAAPLITAASVLSLGLGIGANTALFSILNSLVIRELPVRDPQQLVIVGRTSWSNPVWEQVRDRQFDLFESACAWSIERFDLAPSGQVDAVTGAYVSGGFFHTLGIGTIAGRPLVPGDDVRGGGAEGYVAVVSHRFWRQRLGGAEHALARPLQIGGVPYTIVGVAPPSFPGPEVGQTVDVFLPLAAEAAIRGADSQLAGRSSFWLTVMARLRPDQPRQSAAAAVAAVRPAILAATIPAEWNAKAEYRANYMNTPMELDPAATGVSTLRDRFEQPLTIILAVVAAVLLIACANIANLQLARAAARRREMSLRVALGASRARLACQVLVESLLVAAAGGAAGLALAHAGAGLLVRQLGSDANSITLALAIDWRVLGFTAAVSLGAMILFGMAPAWGMRQVRPNDALKEQGRSVAGDGPSGFRHALIVAQVALSFALVAGAALFIRTFSILMTTPLGFEASGLVILNVDARRAAIGQEGTAAFAQRIAEVAAAQSGVGRASLSYLTPLSGRNWTHRVQVVDGPTLSRPEQTAAFNAVAPGWFDTYGMRVLNGRDLAPSDVSSGERVAVVNEAFVRRFVGARSPLGHRFKSVGLGALGETTIVGVVNDAVYRTVRTGVVPTVYLPMAQADIHGSGFSVTARLAGSRSQVEQDLSRALGTASPGLSYSFRDYQDQVRATLVQDRIVAMLAGFFGALALLLAALGLYGVSSYAVSRRRPEIAIRMALGATSAGVVRLMLRRVATLIAIGGVLGCVLSLWASKFVAELLFRIDARDPMSLGAAAVMLVTVGLFAGWLPARKAARMDPSAGLRN
jgi:predicted permease